MKFAERPCRTASLKAQRLRPCQKPRSASSSHFAFRPGQLRHIRLSAFVGQASDHRGRPNKSFKPTPLHGHNVSRYVAFSIVAVQRRGLTQVLGPVIMPWWLPIYFLVAVTVTVLAFRDDTQDDEPLLYFAAELVSSVLLFVSAFAYWFAPVRNFLGAAAPIVFVIGLSWTGISAYREFKRLKPDPELSRTENAISVAIGGALYFALFSPLAYWGYLWAFQNSGYGA